MFRTCSTGPRIAAIMLLVCALTIRIVVPQGFMWSVDGGGAPRLTSCPGTMPATPGTAISGHAMSGHAMSGNGMAAMPASHHKDGGGHDGKAADHPCAFAGASAAVDLTATFHPVAAPGPVAAADAVLHLFARPGLGLAAPPPPKTGPPTFA